MKEYIISLLLLSFVFTACVPAQTPSTAQAQLPTDNNSPTHTPSIAPTVTPYLTPTRLPTRTRLPTKTPLVSVSLEGVHPGQHAYVFQPGSGPALSYWLYLPESFDTTKQWPLILFLHGSEERGTTIDKVIEQGLPELLETRKDLPFVIVSPQLDSGSWGKNIDAMEELLDHLTETLPIAPDQLYLTGISLGGFGAWDYALQHPDRFAAVAPIAGGYGEQAPDNICTLKDLPIWAFHGDADIQVEPHYSQVLVDALRECGGNPLFTLYPDTGHVSSWEKAYADPALYEWFLTYTK